eukprot:CAMPEP_0184494282 /NCGR_PEP_ID=MMETSP0113_2-20130426/28346_1 /TAXON_ID=91329 /ORGANISM="Norrisiella sphaerica, Strain BC52" /LENGTH=54 /DNA_ID=CAMNT_0026879985 /DNA_START=312 /DNA_END=476 /DNA_ORIENTATION=+
MLKDVIAAHITAAEDDNIEDEAHRADAAKSSVRVARRVHSCDFHGVGGWTLAHV